MDDSVIPLFPVPACVVFGRKRAIAKAMPTEVLAFSGRLPFRDASEAVADKRLTCAKTAAPGVAQRTGGSPYRGAFRQGAILIPRSFVLVERKASGRLGSNPAAPLVVSRRSSQEKRPWRDLPSLEGTVERQFLRPVLLGESILPYRLFHTFEGVVPITDGGRMLNSERALDEGAERLSDWMLTAERSWDQNGKGKRQLIEQFEYIGQLSSQFPLAPVRVVYAASGSLPAAMQLRDQAAVVEHKLYWSAFATDGEGSYLVTILNSETARARAERYQSRGQFGARDFDKVMFNLPIPLFDARDPLHTALAAAGAEAEHVASMVDLVEGERFQRARKRVRDGLIENGIGRTIEKLVDELLGPA